VLGRYKEETEIRRTCDQFQQEKRGINHQQDYDPVGLGKTHGEVCDTTNGENPRERRVDSRKASIDKIEG
jgi:hypothetical protein